MLRTEGRDEGKGRKRSASLEERELHSLEGEGMRAEGQGRKRSALLEVRELRSLEGEGKGLSNEC